MRKNGTHMQYVYCIVVSRLSRYTGQSHFAGANDLSHMQRMKKTTRYGGIGYGVSEAFVLFVVDAILGNDLCDIKVHITAEIENPKNRSPLSL